MKRFIYLLISAVAGTASQHLSAQEAPSAENDATRQVLRKDSEPKVRAGRTPRVTTTRATDAQDGLTPEQEMDARAILRGARFRRPDAPPQAPVLAPLPPQTTESQALALRLLNEQRQAIQASEVQAEIITLRAAQPAEPVFQPNFEPPAPVVEPVAPLQPVQPVFAAQPTVEPVQPELESFEPEIDPVVPELPMVQPVVASQPAPEPTKPVDPALNPVVLAQPAAVRPVVAAQQVVDLLPAPTEPQATVEPVVQAAMPTPQPTQPQLEPTEFIPAHQPEVAAAPAIEPEQPTFAPDEPVVNTQPIVRAEPVASAQPVMPVEPVVPDPFVPAEPVVSAQPVAPVVPTLPIVPAATPSFATQAVVPEPSRQAAQATSEFSEAENAALSLLEENRRRRLGLSNPGVSAEALEVAEQIRAARESQSVREQAAQNAEEAERMREVARIEEEVLRARALRESQTAGAQAGLPGAPEAAPITPEAENQARELLRRRWEQRHPTPLKTQPSATTAPTATTTTTTAGVPQPTQEFAPTPAIPARSGVTDEVEAALQKAEAESRARAEESRRLADQLRPAQTTAPVQTGLQPQTALPPETTQRVEPVQPIQRQATQPTQAASGVPTLNIRQMQEPETVVPDAAAAAQAEAQANEQALLRARAAAEARAAQAKQIEPAVPVLRARELDTAPVRKPTPTSSANTKEQRLEDLLNNYKADKITPAEYHRERVRILAEP